LLTAPAGNLFDQAIEGRKDQRAHHLIDPPSRFRRYDYRRITVLPWDEKSSKLK